MVRGEARDLNPEAGRHEVTMDGRELEAVRRASDRSWSEFPYYDARFGERGRRFSLSDGAWIVTLCTGTAAWDCFSFRQFATRRSESNMQ